MEKRFDNVLGHAIFVTDHMGMFVCGTRFLFSVMVFYLEIVSYGKVVGLTVA